MVGSANILIKSDNDTICLYLYSHWDCYNLPSVLQSALVRGKDRANDFQYITRVIFTEMTKGNVMGLTGYGITTEVYDNERDIITFNTDNLTITIGEQSFSLNDYIKLTIDGFDLKE